MSLDSNDKSEVNSFEETLKDVSNEKIISILRYRDHFQPNAVKAAIGEAIAREIIETVEDLDKDEFKAQQLPPKSLFPVANLKVQNVFLLRSLCRIFYAFGLIPIIYGVIRFSTHNFLLPISAIILGMVTIFVAYKLNSTVKQYFALILLSLNIPAIAAGIHLLLRLGAPTAMDIFAVVLVLLVLLYATLYANKLSIHLERETN